MNFKEARLLNDLDRQVDDLDAKLASIDHDLKTLVKRLDAMCQIFELLLDRKAGRPSKAEVEQLEGLKEAMQ